MAKATPAEVVEEASSAKTPSMKLVIISAVLMALIGAGVGFGIGVFSYQPVPVEGNAAAREGGKESGADRMKGEAETGEQGADVVHGEAAAAGEHVGSAVIVLEPVVTNIAAPSDVWTRFEAVLKASAPVGKEVADLIHQDYMSFFHSMRLEDLEGASSFLDLKAELLSRANARAEGKIESIYIKILLFE
ncbi:MAG: flagellar basal body-associated FliL family protein [Rhizobiaceae bacterium]